MDHNLDMVKGAVISELILNDSFVIKYRKLTKANIEAICYSVQPGRVSDVQVTPKIFGRTKEEARRFIMAELQKNKIETQTSEDWLKSTLDFNVACGEQIVRRLKRNRFRFEEVDDILYIVFSYDVQPNLYERMVKSRSCGYCGSLTRLQLERRALKFGRYVMETLDPDQLVLLGLKGYDVQNETWMHFELHSQVKPGERMTFAFPALTISRPSSAPQVCE